MIFICIDSAYNSFRMKSLQFFYSIFSATTISYLPFHSMSNSHLECSMFTKRYISEDNGQINGMSSDSFVHLFFFRFHWFLSSELIHLAFDWRTCCWNIRFQLNTSRLIFNSLYLYPFCTQTFSFRWYSSNHIITRALSSSTDGLRSFY